VADDEECADVKACVSVSQSGQSRVNRVEVSYGALDPLLRFEAIASVVGIIGSLAPFGTVWHR